MADELTEILRAASKHPNSRVSKLINQVEEERTQKNIVLLLIELAEHVEYSVDFNVSLKYYLDLFERLGINHDLVLNEAGLLLVNSSKIYSKRVDYVQSLVERQILTLSNADDELQKEKSEQPQAENTTPVEKPKRGRKRALEASSDPYEIELAPKKFKKLTEEKRFAVPKTVPKAKSVLRNIEMEQHIHPACWQYATIHDFENDEDVDTKRNYKLFTYHVEHRYNTLVPDINFRLHFKVKDYMDEQEEMEENEACNTDRSWPPLSEAYVQKYLRLENYVLQQDMKANKISLVDLQETREKQSDAIAGNIDPAHDSQQNLNTSNMNESINCNNNIELEQSRLDPSAVNTTLELTLSNKTLADLESSNAKENNDSGLGQSMLDETNNTLNNNLHNCTLETTTTTENFNSNISEAEKSLNANECETGNDSALGTSVLDQGGGNMENNTAENTENLNITANKEILNDSDLKEVNNSLNVANSQLENDSALGTSVLDQTSNIEQNITEKNINAKTEEDKSLNANEGQTENVSALEIIVSDLSGNTENDTNESNSLNITKSQLENDSSLGNSVLDNTTNEVTENIETSQKSICETTTESNRNLDGNETKQLTYNINESALSDDRHILVSTENLATSTEYLKKIDDESGKSLKIDVIQQEDKNSTQIRVHLPNGDDEGVYLSDLEEQYDCRLLSPVINISNILPGVERKDITIVMDEELRQALEMRDGIMKHFGRETFTVPVITEPRKQSLIFNILKLPEKRLRKKVLFKLGPEMDIYLQARSLKRSRPEHVTRIGRRGQFLQWFSLNNTDMTGVCMTPPYSPGHCSDFCGFSDDQDDSASCAGFCGFTEDEQTKLTLKALSRLSRDSGVGADVNNITPDKEASEIKFEDTENLYCNINLNLDETKSVESILKDLPDEIRDILTAEFEGNGENNSTTANKIEETATECNSKLNEDLLSSNHAEETEKSNSQNSMESGIVLTESCSANNTEDSSETTEPLISTNNTKESEGTTENSLSLNSENSSRNNIQESEVVLTTALQNSDGEMSCDETSNREICSRRAEELLKEKLNMANSMEQNDNLEDHHDSNDYIMLDLNTQGNKSKIQQWHEHLQPILAKSRERHHFDVYKLGTEIIDTVQSGEKIIDEPLNESKYAAASSSNPMTSFQDIMENKDKSYVSRYFLSTLLLANQSNIEISIQNKSAERPTAWHDINLKLLSTKRHTVAIEDNIGMIDSKQKAREQNIKQNSKEIQNKTTHNHPGEVSEEDEPLIKLQNTEKSYKKCKTSLKRSSSDNATTSFIADKKPRETSFPTSTINSRHKELPNLIESVQIIKPPLCNASSTVNTSVMPSTSREAQKTNNSLFNVNINAIRTLQPIEKVQKRCDDIDSGIFSIDEMSTS